MSELLKLIENKDKEIHNIQEKLKKTSNINEKEELINTLNNIINEKIELTKIYEKYHNISSRGNRNEIQDNCNPSKNKNEESYEQKRRKK